MNKRGFTLIELLVVVGIMGLLGTASIGAYRSVVRGMEERGAVENASQFVHAAFQRARLEAAWRQAMESAEVDGTTRAYWLERLERMPSACAR